ncbi:GntR family transcriptional regulator [Pararhizobium sp. YC-54]|uniref:GntR family transcriptional regulator n=1 Tax=Pararhizobium sp. YC-54 TaxID=2986920 RepID=UPI0021F70459|nr:GntR family transcriptional regulator [Pararhizobium sp. YC-54]MCV9999748.1 GntR family transcriptional regulator [Pararhizobium sp. YC-54]
MSTKIWVVFANGSLSGYRKRLNQKTQHKSVFNVSRVQSAEQHEVLEFSDSADEQLIIDRVFRAVMEQRLAPGTKLNESVLCKTFGVGRMRVRRALLLLANQGIVDLQSNRGAFVACPDPREANEVFEARMHLEPSLVRQVALEIDAAGVKILKDHIAQEISAQSRTDRTELIRLSGEFHVKIATVTGNTVLHKVMRELVTRTSLIVGLFGSTLHTCCPDDEHEQIFRAIERRDPDASADLIREHLQHIQRSLNLAMPKMDEPDLVSILRGG